jgi:hypothetical protein
VDFVASDCHDMTHRQPLMKNAFEEVVSTYGMALARQLWYENPKQMLENHLLEREIILAPVKKGIISRKIGLLIAACVAIAMTVGAATWYQGLNDDPETFNAREVEDTQEVTTALSQTEEGSKPQEEVIEVLQEQTQEVHPPTTQGIETVSEVVAVSEIDTVKENQIEASSEVPITAALSKEELIHHDYSTYLESLEAYYIDQVEGYYVLLKAASSIANVTEWESKIQMVMDQLGLLESQSDNDVYKALYDMQNDLEDYNYEVAIVQELRDHYLAIKVTMANRYKAQLNTYYEQAMTK